jgi:hypothetical protein
VQVVIADTGVIASAVRDELSDADTPEWVRNWMASPPAWVKAWNARSCGCFRQTEAHEFSLPSWMRLSPMRQVKA